MELKNISQSKLFRGILIGILIVIAVLVVFQAGVAVGMRKAAFAYRFGDRYYQTFDGRRGMMSFFREDLTSGHGAVGKIVKINLPTIVVSTKDNLEKTINITDDTVIRKFRSAIQAKELKLNDLVLVLGEPNGQGEIDAKIIRLMPNPLQESSAASSTNSTNK